MTSLLSFLRLRPWKAPRPPMRRCRAGLWHVSELRVYTRPADRHAAPVPTAQTTDGQTSCHTRCRHHTVNDVAAGGGNGGPLAPRSCPLPKRPQHPVSASLCANGAPGTRAAGAGSHLSPSPLQSPQPSHQKEPWEPTHGAPTKGTGGRGDTRKTHERTGTPQVLNEYLTMF